MKHVLNILIALALIALPSTQSSLHAIESLSSEQTATNIKKHTCSDGGKAF